MSADCAIEPLGDSALLLHFGNGIDATTNARVHAAAQAIAARQLPGIVELVPAYASLAVLFDAAHWRDPHDTPGQHCAQAVREALAHAVPPRRDDTALIEIPVCYGGDFGPDLDAAATRAGLTEAAFAAAHTEPEYRVAMLGFAAGFPYLLGLDARLHLPRRDSPRTRVPAGSVAIGGAQTGIYPRELPGGWNLIGRTPLALFDPGATPPNHLAAGMRVRFRAVDPATFGRLLAGRADP